jgi:hypothetical protein
MKRNKRHRQGAYPAFHIAAALVILAAGTPHAATPDTPSAAACTPRHYEKLLAMLTESDSEYQADAAALLKDYEVVRLSQCREIAGLEEMVASRERMLTLSDRLDLIHIEEATRWAKAYQEEAARPRSQMRRLGFSAGLCLSYPLAGDGADAVQISGAGCWGYRFR